MYREKEIMKLEVTITGLNEAISFFHRLGPNLEVDMYEGMLEAARHLDAGINEVVPHKGYHLDKSGADYHIFKIEEYPNIPEIRCGPSAPYVPILEFGSAAMLGEFQPVYRTTKQGQMLVGLRFTYEGIPDVFFLRPGAEYPAKHYLARSLGRAWSRMVNAIIEAARRAVRSS